MFNTKKQGYGFGPMPGFNRARKGTLGKGNWDRDPKPNRTDCEPFNFKKQDRCSDCMENEATQGDYCRACARKTAMKWEDDDEVLF